MAVELGLTPDDRWPIEPVALMDLAATAGFTALGTYRRWVDGGAGAAELAARGLVCREVLALIIKDDAERTELRARQLAETAAAVGAEWVLTVFETGLTTESLELAERCAAVLAEGGTGLGLEFTPLGPVPTAAQALEVVAALGHGSKIIVDSWHVCLGPMTWDALDRVPLDQIAYVQFDDALPAVSDDMRDESTNRRTVPGAGTLDLDRFATTLLERGWDGLVSIEVLGDAVGLSVPDLVARCHESAVRYWH